MRIFITGVTGSGKTYLANKLKINEFNDHELIEFDKFVDYSDVQSRLLPIYNFINVSNNFIVDAIPVLEGGDLDEFVKYLEDRSDNNTIIYYTYCNKEIWLRDRVPLKQKHLENINVQIPNLNLYAEWYDNFLKSSVYVINHIQKYVKTVKIYDSNLNMEMNLNDYLKISNGVL